MNRNGNAHQTRERKCVIQLSCKAELGISAAEAKVEASVELESERRVRVRNISEVTVRLSSELKLSKPVEPV
jgi:hypothetical protein